MKTLKEKFATKIVVLIAFLLGLLITNISLIVYAHGGDISLIHSCVKTSNGSLRIVGANDSCAGNETALDWNKQGPTGLLTGGSSPSTLTWNDPSFAYFMGPGTGLLTTQNVVGDQSIAAGWVGVPLPGGVLSGFRVAYFAGSGDPSDTIFRFQVYVNGSVSSLSCDVNVGQTSCQDASHLVTVNAGDRVAIKALNPDGSPQVATESYNNWSIQFAPTP